MPETVTPVPAPFSSSSNIGRLRLDARGNIRAVDDRAAVLLGYSNAMSLVASERALPELMQPAAMTGISARRTIQGPGAAGPVHVHVHVTRVSEGAVDILLAAATRGGSDAVTRSCRVDNISLPDIGCGGLYLHKPDGKLLFTNAAFADMLGVDPDALVGVQIQDLVLEEDRPKVSASMLAKWEQGETREITVRVVDSDGVASSEMAVRLTKAHYQGHDVIVGSIGDAEPHRSEKALKDYATRLRQLSRQVLDIQENERRNLARELHDEVGQQLTMLKLLLEAIRAGTAGENAFQQVLQGISDLTQQVRDISLDLRPSMLDDLGLVPALRWYANRIARLADLELSVTIQPDFPRLKCDVETLYFRIAQEAMTNVMRHARARSLLVQLAVTGKVVHLDISDNGCGFDPEAARNASLRGRSAGLLGMHERAVLAGAELKIDAQKDEGTSLRLSIPFARATLGDLRACISATP